MKVPLTSRQAADNLRLECEQCLSRLNEIADIHIELDPATRVIQPDDDEIMYRLRKIRLHVTTVAGVAGWLFDMDMIHVLAPELRAAEEQFDAIEKKAPDELLKALAQDSRLLRGRELLSACVHPTPQKLLLTRERGGLGSTDEVRYFVHLLLLLKIVMIRYALGVNVLSELMGDEKESRIASVVRKANEEFGSMSPADHLRFISPERSDGRA